MPSMKKLILIFFLLIAIIFVPLTVFLSLVYINLPDVRVLEKWTPPQASEVYDYRNRFYGSIGFQKRVYVPLEDIPDIVIKAFISAEDRNFYKHSGIDPGAILRALITNIKAGRIVQGGSTITQQLAKNLFLTRERTLRRKIKEALLAIKIEKTFSKDKILELYLNQIYLGQGAYGVEAASRIYFGKSVRELSLEEAALLAGLPKAPSKFNPFVSPELAKKRRNYVLRRMLEDGYITEEEYSVAVNKPVKVATQNKFRFSDYFLDMVKDYLREKYGEMAFRGGLKIYTTIDLDLQNLATQVLRRGLKRLYILQGFPAMPDEEEKLEEIFVNQKVVPQEGKVFVGKLVKVEENKASVLLDDRVYDLPTGDLKLQGRKFVFLKVVREGESLKFEILSDIQGAIVSIDAKTGAIRAVVGGLSYPYSPFNRAIKAYRQPGSAIKPVIYLAALLKGETQISSIDATPRSFYDPSTGEEWTPKNYDDKEYGVVTLREALAKSINTATVNLLDKLGFEIVLEVGRRVGLEHLKPYYSLALGTVEVTPFQLTSAYQVFANLGVRCTPFFIRRIETSEGRVLEENKPDCQEVLPPQETRVLVDMLRAVITEGTGRRARDLPRIVAGKTGTTDEYMDAWFVGFSPYIVTGVWVGFDVKRSLGEHMSGARVALPIWKDFMAVAASKYPNEDFPLPEGTVVVPINTKDYVVADETCPGVNMVFVEGTQPTLTCSDLREIITP